MIVIGRVDWWRQIGGAIGDGRLGEPICDGILGEPLMMADLGS